MRTLRLVSSHGGRDLSLVDEATGVAVPDVERVEFAPLQIRDGKMFATIFVLRRDQHGKFLTNASGESLLEKMFCELHVGTVWEV